MRYPIRHPLITEKATRLSALGQYVFLADARANAHEVKRAVRERYNVDAVRVRFVNVKPKPRRFRGIWHTKPGYRKAIVTLKHGQKLDILPH